MNNGMDKQHLIVIGNGMVGHHFIDQLVDKGGLAHYCITVIGEESVAAYDRVQLSAMFADKSQQDLMLGDVSWYQNQGIDLRLGQQVVEINRAQQTVNIRDVVTSELICLDYDKLVLATGSTPFVPPIKGNDSQNCFVYRTVDDLAAIKNACSQAKTGAVIGGGLLGLEAANALRLLGLETHVVEFAPRLMPVQLDDLAGDLLAKKITKLGVHIHTDMRTEKITDGETATHRLWFENDTPLEVDVIVFSAGIRPQDTLARQCELEIGERGGIVIDDTCLTSDENIYAIGECALWQARIFGLVAPGYSMARTVASQLVSDTEAKFIGADMSTKLKLLGVEVASIGDAQMRTEGAKELVLQDSAGGRYKKLVVNADSTQILGAILVGDSSDYDALLQCYLNQTVLTEHPAQLLFDTSMLAPSTDENSVVCSCHNVTRGALISQVQQGCHELGEIKQVTKAGTGCGGCSSMVKQIVDEQLASMGMEVNNHVCQHFSYTRQELFHLCQVEKIQDFETLLSTHGKGLGCDICKPTAASIFASLWNEHVLESPYQPLQDSNDAFLANIQKDGSYSVVPRVPGGEITPDKLITLGEVAKKYDLYTKITGGQRVDLFGAQLSQLPDIWAELIEAGFETGHAYGKSLRTVKSCVGSTWCRYGVDDSMALSIELENRYKGLRSPHKLKFAVSGCTRECAEAQSKDIGIIATEQGWNLYVGGNGGMRPRHGDLFAVDLDKPTLIAYIDRILMFYVKTADRLQRTSVWLENLEGGLDYLKQVVIEDKLAINSSLEQQMEHVINSYQCEWKTTLSSEQKLNRFRQFVNLKDEEISLPYQRIRGQRIPIKEEL
ncbi:nitrite reductase (NAD(P)H) [Photobacterium angustum]|uniref:nitrite reductase large subunit NirB n=1 Tax=Photobacterium angustum TaxID=661 RepID=UPI000D163A7D|nr:nitrite reductase large subunit NirB [Photobacterium angustum]PSW91770.1 nitrite reductase (NAD(P)H) [Photobacterium angustum]